MSALYSRIPTRLWRTSRFPSTSYARKSSGDGTNPSASGPSPIARGKHRWTKTERSQDKRPQSSLRSPATLRLTERLARQEIDPVAVLRERIANGTLDIGAANACIVQYRLAVDSGLRRNERLSKVQTDSIGASLLHWLWTDDQRWSQALLHDPLLLKGLCYLMVAEGKQEYIIDLLKVEKPATTKLQPTWRGFLLRDLIKAQLETTLGTSADPVLDNFSGIRGEVLRARSENCGGYNRGDKYATTSLWPAFSEIFSSIASGGWPGTTPSKFVDFVHAYSRIGDRKAVDPRWSHARISLHIPGVPEYRPALSYMKQLFADNNDQDLQARIPYDDPGARAQIYFVCRRLENLISTDHPEDAQWVQHLRTRLFTTEDLGAFKEMWRRMLWAFGVQDPGYDLETLVTWDPDSYWLKQREEEHRLHSSVK